LKTVDLARTAIAESQKENPQLAAPKIGASMGPYGAYLADGSEYRGNYGISEKELFNFHRERIQVLHDSDVDLLLFETFPDLLELEVIARITSQHSKPAWVSFACKDGAHLNDGTPIEEAASLFNNHPTVFAIGVNCTKPAFISELIQRMKNSSDRRIVVYPNSNENYDADSKTWSGENESEQYTVLAKEWLAQGADLIGGCCRIGPGHIKSLAHSLASKH
jgi:homocysteine S-methyltransferase